MRSKEGLKKRLPDGQEEKHPFGENSSNSKVAETLDQSPDVIVPPIQKKDPSGDSKNAESVPKTSFLGLFTFVSGSEYWLLVFGIFFSCAQGLGMPLMTFILGNLTNSFAPNNPPAEVESAISKQFLQMIYLGIGVLACCSISSTFWNILSARQSKKIKLIYFRKLLDQNSTWYDKVKIDQLSANFIDQISSFAEVFSEKLNLLFMYYATSLGGLIIGFVRGWLLTLFVILLTPILFFGLYFFVRVIRKSEEVQRKAYGQAGAISDECFTYIKSVKSLNGEEHEIDKYSKSCASAMNVSIRFGYKAGLLWGNFFFSMLVLYGLAYLIGSRLIADGWINSNTGEVYKVGDVLTVFFSVVMGIFSFGSIGPIMKNLEAAKVAIAHIIDISKKNESEKSGSFAPETIKGDIVFENVSFHYPSNPKVQVLKNLSFSIKAGQKVAFVGPSGSGKSTVVQLLERFYDPTEGRILLDGKDIREYNIKFLRSKIGLVSQQPVLFAETIKYNILLGMINQEEIPDADIWKALDEAVASDFVRKFNNQLNEYVGTQGGQLSGGQKQRIAIARALVRNPSIFLFDEATSALDRTNEMEIQKTLDRLASMNTSITVAHRLTTIRNSDNLFVLKNGVLMQSGTHDELFEDKDGLYFKLVQHQMELQTEEPEHHIEPHDGPSHKQEPTFDNHLKSLKEDMAKSNPILIKEASRTEDSEYVKMNSSAQGLQKVVSQGSVKDKPSKGKLKLSQFLGPEKNYIALGLFAAAVQGAVMPVFGYLYAIMIEKLGELELFKNGPTNPLVDFTKSDVLHAIDLTVIGFMIVAVGSFVFNFLQFSIFNHVGERFTFTMRKNYFRRLMYKDMEYFDQEENQPGSLSSRLAIDCKTINTLIGTYLGAILQSFSSLIVGIIIAFVYSWKITLVMFALIPLLLIAGAIRAKVMHSTGKKAKLEGSDLLPETLNNMKVLRSLNAEDQLYKRFEMYSELAKRKSLKVSWVVSILFGFSQFTMFLVYAILFRVGAKFHADSGLTMRDFFISMFVILFGAMGTGSASSFLSNAGEAKVAAEKILAELNSESLIERDPLNPNMNPSPNLGLKPEVVGKIEFRKVEFTYKGRQNKVLNGLTLAIPPSQTSAFVGTSGCGKSTLMQMLLRFYDPQAGEILIDDVNIKDYDITHLRSIFGMVRQEPTLFNGTIEYNVKYNMPNVTDEEMKEACLAANALDFINDTPEGYQRDVGNRGEKMSGGQKQRLAIARVLVRKPKILLFDEATSALDSQSEAIVQSALEEISKTRASISIAHRISTIKESDCIFVLELGKVIEKGNYSELMALKRRFAELAHN